MNKLFFLFVIVISSVFDCCSIFEKIAQENLATLEQKLQDGNRSFSSYSSYLQWVFNEQTTLDPFRKRQLALAMLKEYEEKHPFPDTTVIDFVSLQDLNLIKGPKSDVTLYLGAQVDRTHTEIGRMMLFSLLATPISDKTFLSNRQAVVKELLANKDLFDALEQKLLSIKKSENLLFSFWAYDAFQQAAKQKSVSLPWESSLTDWFNTCSPFIELQERFSQASSLLSLVTNTASAVIIPTTIALLFLGKKTESNSIKKWGEEKLGTSTILGIWSVLGAAGYALNKAGGKRMPIEAGHSAMVACNYGLSSYFSFESIRSNALILTCLQSKLIEIARIVKLLHECKLLLEENSILKENLQLHNQYEELFAKSQGRSKDLDSLIDLLGSSTFSGESSIFSLAGRILAAYSLMEREKASILGAMVCLGELDVYISIAKLYSERAEGGNQWCFPSYSDAIDTPQVELAGFWNPFLTPEKAVANTVSIGTENNPKTLIITGPNAGGKSTTMKSIVLSLILAQSLAIAPATAMKFTPFSKISTYLNITDDIAAGNSYFKAGILRAQELIDMANNLPENTFGFIAADEIFNGTTHDEGEAAAYGLIEFLGKQKQIACASATHFHYLTKLQETNDTLFKNYKVPVTYDADNAIQYPYKLECGVSKQHIAFDILREEGFNEEILLGAQRVLGRNKSLI